MKKVLKLLKWGLFISFVGVFLVVFVNLYMISSTENYIFSDVVDVPEAEAAMILGAFVDNNGALSDILMDRTLKAFELYEEGKVQKLIVSGDHGSVEYNEVGAVKDFLLKKGVKSEDIFLDHAGFDTYDSLYRADKIFNVKSLVVVTQEFHLNRAVYIARANGIEAYGYIADRQPYIAIEYYRLRELLARSKSFVDVLFNAQSKFLGKKIPITGVGTVTWD